MMDIDDDLIPDGVPDAEPDAFEDAGSHIPDVGDAGHGDAGDEPPSGPDDPQHDIGQTGDDPIGVDAVPDLGAAGEADGKLRRDLYLCGRFRRRNEHERYSRPLPRTESGAEA